jgi:hypothetical protein
MHCLKEYLIIQAKEFGKLKTWIYVYIVLFLVTALCYILNYPINSVLSVEIISFLIIVIISIYKDYIDGKHRFWNREKYKEKGENGLGSKQNSQ